MGNYIREPVNGLTHLVGAIFAFLALLAMVIKAAEQNGSGIAIFAVILFGISMILLYSASATYHMVIAKEKVITFLRKLDHAMIFILIAGTYAPFCLISLQGFQGWFLFSIISLLALAGVVFKLVWFHCPRWLSTGIYLAMGWMVIFFISPLANTLETKGLALLVLGGIFYTIGGIIYGIKPKIVVLKYFGYHETFHIFILLGSFFHFLSVFLYVI